MQVAASTDPGDPSPAPRRRLGDYEVIRPIGRGGIAVVYLARQLSLERRVALKELNSFHGGSPDMAERFVRESRIAGSLSHPNVATVFEYFEHERVRYIAMEYMQRGSLRPYVGRLSFAQFVGVMEGVLAGLTHAETLGIVHRDLKPENLLVTDEGRVKITDFGIAKARETGGSGSFVTTTGTTVGTPAYMAPEQAMAQEIGPWTDLYSVGVMAWEHMVGHPPFQHGEAPMVVLMRHINEPIPLAIEARPNTDPDVSDWIGQLLIKDPGARTRSPAAAWDRLEEIVIRRLGPRWRRDARLPTATQILDTPKPLTPAPFESQRAPAVEPRAKAYVTFENAPRSPTAASAMTPTPQDVPYPDTLPPRDGPAPPTPPTPASSLEPPASAGSEGSDQGAQQSESAPQSAVDEHVAPGRREASARRRAVGLTALAAAAAATAFIGTSITRSSPGSDPKPRPVQSGPLEISLPANWARRLTTSLPGLTLADELVAGPETASGRLLAMGTARSSDPTLLPSALLASLSPRAAKGQVVRLGASVFYRYRNVTPSGAGRPETVYALPTTDGTVIAVCASSEPSSTFTGMCEHVIASLRLTSGHVIRLGPRHAYGAALGRTITKLNTATHAAGAELARARSAAGQAKAAKQLAAAYGQAAASLRRVDPGPAAATDGASLTRALIAAGDGYERLAKAAAAGDKPGYEKARHSIARAGDALEHSLTRLAKFGYEVRTGRS